MADGKDPEIIIPGQERPQEQPTGEFIQQPAKLMRIAAMMALRESLSDELQQELATLTLPLEGNASQSEIRIAQAQLVGWLEGLFHGIQAALWSQQMQARAQIEEMRRRGLPPGPEEDGGRRPPGHYL
jgi:hypothetical protein